MIMKKPIYLTPEDHAKLRLLLSAYPAGRSRFAKLHEELERAVILQSELLADDVVRIGSRIQIADLETGEVADYTHVLPEQADLGRARLSVLAPIGTAVLGYSQKDEIIWETPGGRRRIQLRRVGPPNVSPANPLSSGPLVSTLIPQTFVSKSS